MSDNNEPKVKVSNYLVPATGGTSSMHVKYASDGTLDSPIILNFSQQAIDGEPFNPSGFFANNHSLTDSVYIRITGNNLIYEIPPASNSGRQYPAPFGHNAEIYGLGDADIVFVNFPVIPYSNGGSSGDSAGIGSITDNPVTSFTDSASVISLLKMLGIATVGEDTDGNPLPNYFDTLPETLAYTSGKLTTENKSDGGSLYTRTYSYSSDVLTNISGWVKTTP